MNETVNVEKSFDGNFTVYVNGVYRFHGDEAACHQWIKTVIIKPAQDAKQRDAMLDRAMDLT